MRFNIVMILVISSFHYSCGSDSDIEIDDEAPQCVISHEQVEKNEEFLEITKQDYENNPNNVSKCIEYRDALLTLQSSINYLSVINCNASRYANRLDDIPKIINSLPCN